MSTPSVIVVEDHDLFRGGLVVLLQDRGVQVLGQTGLASEAVEMARVRQPDVVLMDISMPGGSGIEATHSMTAAAPMTRVLMLTVANDEDSVMQALLAGACGYLLKDTAIDQIVEAIRTVAGGESVLSPSITTQLIRRSREPAAVGPTASTVELTLREHEVLELISRGMDNPEIAAALHLSTHTVKNHVSSILGKLQVENRVQAAVRAIRGGLV